MTLPDHPSPSPRSPTLRGSARLGLAVLALLAATFVLSGCGADPGARLPEGLTLAGGTAAMVPVLETLEGLEGSPLAREAAALRARIAGCERFVAHCPPRDPAETGTGTLTSTGACRLAEVAECTDALPDWMTADGEGDPADFGLVSRAGDGLWLLLRGRSGGAGDAGSIVIDGEAGPVGLDRALSLLLPAEEPPGPARMADREALLHLRVRPDGGLDLARFVEGEGWGARMYRLRSDLFEGKALAGVWELAVYPPAEGELITPMALSLDIEPGERELAVSAMEQFLAELEEVWPVRRSDYRLGEHEGACLGNVRVMPDLAPCYLATPEALMVGWSSRSLEMALAENDPGGGPGADPEGSGGRVFFSRFPAADRVIAGATGAPGPVDRSFYPWDLLELTGGRDEAVYRFRARLGPEAAR
jgi:hypothetical protein